jgi:hypothetical protein
MRIGETLRVGNKIAIRFGAVVGNYSTGWERSSLANRNKDKIFNAEGAEVAEEERRGEEC